MTNISRTYELSTKFCSYVTTGKVFQIGLRGREYSPQREEWEILLGENYFSLVRNSSLRLKMNVCILELSILFSKELLFLYYIQVIGFWFFFEKKWSPIYFIVLFYLGYVLDFMMYHIWYTIHFFPKIWKATFNTSNFNLLIFYFGLKTRLFSRFY